VNFLPRQLELSGVAAYLREHLPAGATCWLVGGALRDDQLGSESRDFDFALDVDPTSLARGLTTKLGGTFVALDPGRCQSRVVLGKGEGTGRIVLDFAPLRAGTLDEDLALRDFTCNALACNLNAPDRLIDPLMGARDILRSTLRPCATGVLADDPLRILKGIRHTVELGLVPSDDFYEEARRSLAGLADIASERIKLELGRIFVHPHVRRSAPLFERTGVMSALCGPEEGEVAGDVTALDHALHAELDFPHGGESSPFARTADVPWTLAALVRFHRYLSGARASSRKAVFGRLKFSRMATSLMRLFEAFVSEPCSPPGSKTTRRGRGVWLDRFQPSPPAAALYLASLSQAARWDIPAIFADWSDSQSAGRVPDLVPAQELMSTWGVAPGPALGRVLADVRDAEVSGRISSTFDIDSVVRESMKKD